MDYKAIELLKKDLKKAIDEKNMVKAADISAILNMSNSQKQYFDRGLTGYPSIDMTWLKYYANGLAEKVNIIPKNKTVWDVIEEKLEEYYEYPAIEYFETLISREDFVERVYTWARTFRAMGVEPDEVVPIYGPFFPDICAMVFALNAIGATPYFLKLMITPEYLSEETKYSKVAVVYDGMWKNVECEFSKDRFKTVIVASSDVDMPSPKKEIVSFLSKMQAIKNKSRIPEDKKYIWLDDAKKIANYYTGNVKVPFVKDRSAFITASSGTTIGGTVKGVVATNEATIVHMQMGKLSGIQYFPGDLCLDQLPPTISTSLNVLFFYALYNGMTVLIDPRVSEKDFYNQIVNRKPNMALTTGSAWEAFFNRVAREMDQGKKFDFSCAKAWTVGGEGTDVKKYKQWMDIMERAHATNKVFTGYGLSELFSAVSVEELNALCDFSKSIMSVGIPYVGMNVGVFDENGNELPYNKRGELWIKSKTAMKEYYNKPELTNKTKVNGWIRSGDLAEIDENGFLYVWGRMSDRIELNSNNDFYLFDIANKIKENKYIVDSLVLRRPTNENPNNVVAHIALQKDLDGKKVEDIIDEINESMIDFLPTTVVLDSFCIHDTMIPYSLLTMKKDRHGLSEIQTGFFNCINGELVNIDYIKNENGNFIKKCDIMEKKIKKRIYRKE